jgi:hypothetical protein
VHTVPDEPFLATGDASSLQIGNRKHTHTPCTAAKIQSDGSVSGI